MDSQPPTFNYKTDKYLTYPQVLNWDNSLNQSYWKLLVKEQFDFTNKNIGISLSIQFPDFDQIVDHPKGNAKEYISNVIKEFDMYLNLFGDKPNLSALHYIFVNNSHLQYESLSQLTFHICSKVNLFADKTFTTESISVNDQSTLLLLDKSKLQIGLGIANISDSGNGYIQNEGSYEEYVKRMKNNEFPISKTHYLSMEEQNCKRIIFDILKNHEVTLSSENCSNEYFILLKEISEEFVANKLITFYHNKIRLTASGLDNVNLVCGLFDVYSINEAKKIGIS